ncbi:MAG: DUF4389 domain-containing protein [Acidimicrobiales bacterium]
MTDTPPGPGWWKASDGQWYPPEQHQDPAHRARYAAPTGQPMPPQGPPPGVGYASSTPAADAPSFIVDSPYEVANWRPLVNWILAIPHLIIAGVLRYAVGVVGVIVWFAVLFTGRIPPGLYGFLAMHMRYETRANAFLYGFTEQYPPFEFPSGPTDDRGFAPVRVELPAAPEQTPRSALFNFILAIPHYIVFFVIAIGAAAVALIGWFAVLFTGRWPEGMRDFLVRFGNYWFRIWVYTVMVETKYPEFGLK